LPIILSSIATQGLDTRLGRRQQLREDFEIAAAGRSNPERYAHVDPGRVPARRKPQLALAGKQCVPRPVLLPADQGVLAIEAALSIGSGFAPRRGGRRRRRLGNIGPSARLKMPAAEGPEPFFPRSAAPGGA
jgi:hypothetical protein